MRVAVYPLRTNAAYTACPVFKEISRSADCPPMRTPI